TSKLNRTCATCANALSECQSPNRRTVNTQPPDQTELADQEREGGSMRNRIFITSVLFALITLASSVKAQMNDSNEALERANSLFHRGQYELPIFDYRHALECAGAHQARARFNVGVCNHRLGRTREAVTDYLAAIKLRESRFPSASYALGIALQDLRRYQEAREAFTQAVKSSGGKHAEA